MDNRQATSSAKWLRQLGTALRSRDVISVTVSDDGSVVEMARYPTRDIYLAGRDILGDFDKMLTLDAVAGTAARP